MILILVNQRIHKMNNKYKLIVSKINVKIIKYNKNNKQNNNINNNFR